LDDIPPSVDPVSIRYRRRQNERSGSNPRVPRFILRLMVKVMVANGFAESRMWFVAAPDSVPRRLNAELSAVDGIPALWYSLEPWLPMRPALARSGQHARGLAVWALLRQLMPGEDFLLLREMYDSWCDNHTIEFTVADKPVIGSSHLIIWEVRSY
jgi:hypothetical protein